MRVGFDSEGRSGTVICNPVEETSHHRNTLISISILVSASSFIGKKIPDRVDYQAPLCNMSGLRRSGGGELFSRYPFPPSNLVSSTSDNHRCFHRVAPPRESL